MIRWDWCTFTWILSITYTFFPLVKAPPKQVQTQPLLTIQSLHVVMLGASWGHIYRERRLPVNASTASWSWSWSQCSYYMFLPLRTVAHWTRGVTAAYDNILTSKCTNTWNPITPLSLKLELAPRPEKASLASPMKTLDFSADRSS